MALITAKADSMSTMREWSRTSLGKTTSVIVTLARLVLLSERCNVLFSSLLRWRSSQWRYSFIKERVEERFVVLTVDMSVLRNVSRIIGQR